MNKKETRFREVAERIRVHLIGLGCVAVPEDRKVVRYLWEVELATEAGLLSLSVSGPHHNFELESLMVHGRFEFPEKFPVDFTEWNRINRHSGKWNTYVWKPTDETEVVNVLRYFSGIIPLLDESDARHAL